MDIDVEERSMTLVFSSKWHEKKLKLCDKRPCIFTHITKIRTCVVAHFTKVRTCKLKNLDDEDIYDFINGRKPRIPSSNLDFSSRSSNVGSLHEEVK